jgi:hypothetical protein
MKNKTAIRASRLLIVIFFYGSVVGFTGKEKNTEKTWIDFLAGFGSFTQVIRDCSGNVIHHDDYPFFDGAISVRHTFGYGAITGKIGGFTAQKSTHNLDSLSSRNLNYSSVYGGVALGLNTPFLGLDLGILYFNNIHSYYMLIEDSHFQPMGRLRLGFEDAWYFSVSIMDNDPLFSGGGMFDMGLGFRIAQSESSIWFGLGGGPYADTQFILKTEIVPKEWKTKLLFSGNIGFGDDGSTEYGVSLGARIDLH